MSSEDTTDENSFDKEKSGRNISRRQALGGGAAAALGIGALGAGVGFMRSESYLTDVNRGQVELMADNQRNTLEQVKEDFEATNSSLEVSTDIDDYQGRGKLIDNNFVLKQAGENSDNYIVPRENDGQSVEFVNFESPEDMNPDEITLQSVIDRTDNDIGDIAISQALEGRKTAEVEEFQEVVAYLPANEDGNPDVNNESLESLETLKQELDEAITEDYLSLMSNLENVSTNSGDLIHDEIGESGTERIAPVGTRLVSGENYRESDHLTENEASNLLQGEGEYEEVGLYDTKSQADELIQEVAADTVKTAIVSDTLGRAIETAGGTAEFYFSESEQTYAGLELDGELEEEIEGYADERGLESEELEYQVRSKDDEVTLRYGEDLDSGDYEELSLGE